MSNRAINGRYNYEVPEEYQEPLREGTYPRVNVYTCAVGHQTFTVDVDLGVTPFSIACPKCPGHAWARSSLYQPRIPTTDDCTHEWYRPFRLPKNHAEADHVRYGGLLMRARTKATPVFHEETGNSKPASPGFVHIDDWVAGPVGTPAEEGAKTFFRKFCVPAMDKDYEWIYGHRLTAKYKNGTYRVTGASRLGDVWLAKSLDERDRYDYRVGVNELTDWELTKL